jgi:hypothetical protein
VWRHCFQKANEEGKMHLDLSKERESDAYVIVFLLVLSSFVDDRI